MHRIDDTLVLTERQNRILRAVIEEYIATAQPVSSSFIADMADIRASSATIRNEMGRLEEVGLLLQPHTSAGRIPTDLGYRYYVDHLLTEYRLQRDLHPQQAQQRDAGIEATCRLLGQLTKYTTLALVSGWQEYRLQQIEVAPVGDDQLLVVIVTDNHQVLHSLSTVPDRPGPAQLRQLNDLLNEEFNGKPLTELSEEALRRAVTKLPHLPNTFFRNAPEYVRRGLSETHAESKMHVEGATYIFEQQDFAEVPKLRALMEALQEESVFEQLFMQSTTGEIMLSIGTENPHPGLGDCALVFTSYPVSEHVTGRVGVLGPKRMPYRQIIRIVDAVVHNLDQRFGANPNE